MNDYGSEMMMASGAEGNSKFFCCADATGYGLVEPVKTATETVLPAFGSTIKEFALGRSVAPMKRDSDLTCAVSDSRKRSREAVVGGPSIPSLFAFVQNRDGKYTYGSSMFVGDEDMRFQIQRQQSEIGLLVAEHTEKLRREIEERGKKYCRRIAAAVQEKAMMELKARDDEIQKMVTLNLTLEENVKALILENQIWRDFAHTNEATATALRCNLEQMIAQRRRTREAAFCDDAQSSCCGSNGGEIEIGGGKNAICRSCGKEDACVVLLPCRHLCLCTICGMWLSVCPVCNSAKTGSVRVNLCGRIPDF